MRLQSILRNIFISNVAGTNGTSLIPNTLLPLILRGAFVPAGGER